MGFSVYPHTKMSEARTVAVIREFGVSRILVNSAADWGRSDPLKTRRTADAMLADGFTVADVEKVFWHNPVAFYGRSGRLRSDERDTTPAQVFAGNSVQRGGQEDACD
jgi:predicted metal-dependent TIM-barrel fold hydrolase